MAKKGHFLKTQNTLNTLHHEVFATGSEAEKNLTQIAARFALALRAPVSVRHQWASPQHSSSKLVLCIRLAPLVGREHFVVEQIEQIIF